MTDSREVHFSWTIAEWRLRSWQELKRSMLCRKLCSELCSFVARWTEARYAVGNSNATWKYCSVMFVCSCIPLCISNVTYESGFFPPPRGLRFRNSASISAYIRSGFVGFHGRPVTRCGTRSESPEGARLREVLTPPFHFSPC